MITTMHQGELPLSVLIDSLLWAVDNRGARQLMQCKTTMSQ